MILLLISGLGRPGSIVAKSITNSLCEWVMSAKLEYEPFATSGLSSSLSSFSFDIVYCVLFRAKLRKILLSLRDYASVCPDANVKD